MSLFFLRSQNSKLIRTMYLVSLLVPIYGVELYIERCARSLFEQTYPNLEYVFVDDCSPDNSCDILQKTLEDYPHRKSMVKIVHHSTNRGLAAVRNTALDYATGDFVCVVDSDDWLEDGAIAHLVRKQAESDADIVTGNAYIHYHEGVKELSNHFDLDKERILTRQLKDTWTMWTFLWGRLYKRSLFEDNKIRCIEGADYAEDRYQVVRLYYYANKFSFVEEFVYNYEKRNDSSITVMQKTNVTAYLKNQYQHLLNWIGILDFFRDKENEYYKLAVSNTSRLLEMYLKWALKYGTREDFRRIVRMIDENEDCMEEIGWRKSGLRGRLEHHYFIMWIWQLAERSARLLRRKLHLGEDN